MIATPSAPPPAPPALTSTQRLGLAYLDLWASCWGLTPVYVYGPACDGLAEMILVPRCQRAMAISAWDPHLRDYVVYSTLYGDSVLESSGFENFVSVTGRITGLVRKASKVVP